LHDHQQESDSSCGVSHDLYHHPCDVVEETCRHHLYDQGLHASCDDLLHDLLLEQLDDRYADPRGGLRLLDGDLDQA